MCVCVSLAFALGLREPPNVRTEKCRAEVRRVRVGSLCDVMGAEPLAELAGGRASWQLAAARRGVVDGGRREE